LKTQVAVVDVSPVKKDLTIEVAVEEVKAEFEKTYQAYAQYVRVPGFRPGKVPRDILKQRFANDVKDEVLKRLLPHALEHAITDHNLRVIGEPQIADVSFAEGTPLRFRASLEVLPDVELKEYKGLQVTKRVRQVTDEDVENVLNHWRERSAEFVSVEDRPAQASDFVSVNLLGKYVDPQGPQEEEGLQADDVQIELGAEGVQAAFNEHLTGVQAGEVREFRVAYPEDFTSQGLAGKTLDFTATVVAVRQKEVPEADDEFAKQFGEEYNSIQQLREQIRKDLEQSAENEADARLRDAVLDKLLEAYEFQVPDVLIEQQAKDRLRSFIYRLASSGLPPEVTKTINWEERLGEERIMAVKDVRAALIVGQIGEVEKIRVTNAEIDVEIARMAAGSGMTAEALKARLTKEDELPSIQNRLHYDKVLGFVVNNADVTVETVTAEQLEAERREITTQTDEPEAATPAGSVQLAEAG
jgi:trigger factor